jgi:hypothetical protein
MSFLATLFDVPKSWQHRWVIDEDGEIAYCDSLQREVVLVSGKDGRSNKKVAVHEMSKTELAGIAGSCNPKELKLVLRRGGDSALINSLGNPAMGPEMLSRIIERAPSAGVLQAIGRSRFAKIPAVSADLCKNIMTPLFLSRTLIGRVSKSNLKTILKTPGLSPSLKIAIRKKLTRKKRR